ncbi:hypothetical protein KI614_09310 [Dechloromonas denitrificans]|uniref:hypothetical protein n=1 Tax=Dechloromonas denitrificans TaxID=281362 RepID=UPI001CF8AE45|nr:hypothetical protein [Dechloromonas denitrificans]UCV10406.1 hypothetical protein KI614_09310 [Dechloromonas denitrificans]
MMTEEMIKQMPHMMSQAGHMMSKPMATGAMMAGAGFAAGKGLLSRAVLHNPLALLAVGAAGGIAAGFLLFKYQKEIVDGLSKATGMGKEFALHQKENLNDLMAETQEKFEGNPPPASASPRA